jgi:hypothetical protein
MTEHMLAVKDMRAQLVTLTARLQTLDVNNFFGAPVCEQYPSIARAYRQAIKVPMDFDTLRKRCEGNDYGLRGGLEQYRRDCCLISTNCMAFNEPTTEYYAAATKLLEEMEAVLDEELPLVRASIEKTLACFVGAKEKRAKVRAERLVAKKAKEEAARAKRKQELMEEKAAREKMVKEEAEKKTKAAEAARVKQEQTAKA